MNKKDITGVRYGRLEALWPCWKNEKGHQIWMVVCDCKNIRFIYGSSFVRGNRQSCGCLRKEVSRKRTIEFNKSRAGKPRSEKGKLASLISCKKMNWIRHLKAKHLLSNVDSEKYTAYCSVCGRVPVKIQKHRHAKWNVRDQAQCWVGTLNRNDRNCAEAVVSYPNHALEMLEKQNNLCALCGREMVSFGNSADSITLDHCHTTGRLRGYIHQSCNHGLGHFKDSIEVLNKAIKYLNMEEPK